MNIDYLDIFGGLILVGLIVSKPFYGDSAEYEAPTKHQTVNKVNNVANSVTTIETEVYRVVCVESADTFCKEYSVRKINRE